MSIRTALASLTLATGLLTSLPADAKELREPKYHFVLDVPDNWTVQESDDKTHGIAFPTDQSFHLFVHGSERALADEAADKEHAISFLKRHFKEIHIDHTAKVDNANFAGVEFNGKATEHNNAKGEFFVYLLIDKKDPDKKRGAVVVGTGTMSGFHKHHGGIREALKTMHTT
jgi:hypothetical protein